MVGRIAVVLACVLAALPVHAGEIMKSEEARRFVVGNLFAFNCFDGREALQTGKLFGPHPRCGAGGVLDRGRGERCPRKIVFCDGDHTRPAGFVRPMDIRTSILWTQERPPCHAPR